MPSTRYRFRPELELRVSGDRRALRHFDAEYGEAAVPDDGSPPAVEVRFKRVVAGAAALGGGHKTVRWLVAPSAPDAAPLVEDIELRGVPRSFGLSLVQGYFVEPLLSVAAARAGYVLLPAAATGHPDGAVILMGASGAGKSTLSVRALAAGHPVVGDDQTFLGVDGCCFRFPRRMRFYSDLRIAAPAAWSRLGALPRARLHARRGLRALSRGLIAPSLPVKPSAIGDTGPAGPFRVARVVLLERSADTPELRREPLDVAAATDCALGLLDEQRERFRTGALPAWEEALAQVRALEARIIGAAFSSTQLERVSVPAGWSAGFAISSLATELGTER